MTGKSYFQEEPVAASVGDDDWAAVALAEHDQSTRARAGVHRQQLAAEDARARQARRLHTAWGHIRTDR